MTWPGSGGSSRYNSFCGGKRDLSPTSGMAFPQAPHSGRNIDTEAPGERNRLDQKGKQRGGQAAGERAGWRTEYPPPPLAQGSIQQSMALEDPAAGPGKTHAMLAPLLVGGEPKLSYTQDGNYLYQSRGCLAWIEQPKATNSTPERRQTWLTADDLEVGAEATIRSAPLPMKDLEDGT